MFEVRSWRVLGTLEGRGWWLEAGGRTFEVGSHSCLQPQTVHLKPMQCDKRDPKFRKPRTSNLELFPVPPVSLGLCDAVSLQPPAPGSKTDQRHKPCAEQNHRRRQGRRQRVQCAIERICGCIIIREEQAKIGRKIQVTKSRSRQ